MRYTQRCKFEWPRATLSDSKIFNDMEYRAASLRHELLVYLMNGVLHTPTIRISRTLLQPVLPVMTDDFQKCQHSIPKKNQKDWPKHTNGHEIMYSSLEILISILAVWLSGNSLASINVVALRQTRLVLGWVTVCGRVNHFGM